MSGENTIKFIIMMKSVQISVTQKYVHLCCKVKFWCLMYEFLSFLLNISIVEFEITIIHKARDLCMYI